MRTIFISLFSFVINFSTFAGQTYLEKSLYKLASDEFQGRAAGSESGKLAEKFLVEEFKKSGLSPFGRGFEQSFTIFTQMQKKGLNNFILNGESIRFEPLTFSDNGKLKKVKLVFAGYGISLPKNDANKYDDYSGVDAQGRIVIVMTGDPGIAQKDSIFRNPDYINYRSTYYKIKNAIAHKAAGVIIVHDPLSLSSENPNPDIFFNPTDGGGSRFDIMAGRIKLSTASSLLLKSTGKDLKALQKKISKTQRPSSFELNLTASMSVDLAKKTGRVSNILGFKEGSDPVLKKEVIVIGAHFDHLGLGGQSSMEPGNKPQIHFGADDNGSGTALILKMIKDLRTQGFKRSIVFSLFNAEEIGLLGSQHFVRSWPRYQGTYGDLKFMLNFDMVGRFQKELAVMATGSAFEWNGYIEQTISAIKKTKEASMLLPLALQKKSVGSSDHASFIAAQIPSLFFSTGAHEDYHRPSDTPDKIDYKSLEKVNFIAKKLLINLDRKDILDLNFDPESVVDMGGGRNRGYGSHLGCIPKFGQADDIVGVICTGASAGSPAAIAGMREGDILIQLGEIEVKSIYDLAFGLKYYRAGDKIEISWKRGKEILSKEITLTKKEHTKHKGCNHDWENLSIMRNEKMIKL